MGRPCIQGLRTRSVLAPVIPPDSATKSLCTPIGVSAFTVLQRPSSLLPLCPLQKRSFADMHKPLVGWLALLLEHLHHFGLTAFGPGPGLASYRPSDFPCRPQQIPYPSGLYESGRIVLARHFLADVQFQVATVYGYVSGPTWPDARPRTDNMLRCLTHELVLGARGLRAITGDFNHDLETLEQCAIWRSHGWIELQNLAESLWGTAIRPTCKHATRRDYIWLSPEAAACCVQASVIEVFQEHSTLIAGFSLPGHAVSEITWPLPSEIPWPEVHVDDWHRANVHEPVAIF